MMYLYSFYYKSSDPQAFSGVFSAPSDEIIFSMFANKYLSFVDEESVYINELAVRNEPIFRIGMMNSSNGLIEPTEPVDLTEEFLKFLHSWLANHSIRAYYVSFDGTIDTASNVSGGV